MSLATHRPPQSLRAACTLLVLLGAADVDAQTADNGDARIRELERRLDESTRRMQDELDLLRRELKAARESIAAPVGPTAAPPVDAVPAARATETADLRHQLTETREQLGALQSRMDQQGIQHRFADGVTFEDPRGNWTVKLSGRAQLDYRHFVSGGDLLANTFAIRRARLGASVTLFKDFAVTVEGEFAGDSSTSATTGTPASVTSPSSTMTLGFLEYQRWPHAKFRLGQFKPQFGLEQTLLDLQSDFMERALTQNILDGNNINYDRGIMVHGAPFAPMYYALSVTNGNGQNRDERQASVQDARTDGKDVTARVVFDFAQAFGVPDTVLHLGGSFKRGTLTNSTATPFAPPAFRTEARGLTFFTPESLNGGAGVAAQSVRRELIAAEASASWKSLRLTGEWWLADYRWTQTAPGVATLRDTQIQASYVSLLWLATGETWSDFYRGGYWQKVRPDNRFSMESGGGWGAVELGLRYSRMDASDFVPSTLGTTGSGRFGAGTPLSVGTNRANAFTAQLKWIHNPFSRMLLDYVRTNFDTPVSSANPGAVTADHETAITARYQVDF